MSVKFIIHHAAATQSIYPSLSFYKEELAGETNNYIHLRATAEQTSVDAVLRDLVEEVTDTAVRVGKVAADDEELSKLWDKYMQVRLPPLHAAGGASADGVCTVSVLLGVPPEDAAIPPR